MDARDHLDRCEYRAAERSLTRRRYRHGLVGLRAQLPRIVQQCRACGTVAVNPVGRCPWCGEQQMEAVE